MRELILGYEKLRIAQASREEIEEFLASYGISKDSVPDFIETYDSGFKHGVNHVITCGESSKELDLSRDPVFASAFNMGKHRIRMESSVFYRYRGFFLLFVVASISFLILRTM